MNIERGSAFLDTLSYDQQLFLYNILNFNIDSICWDLDQTLLDTEVPVKEAFDEHFGTSYRFRKVDRFRALTAWAVKDGVANEDIAKEIEDDYWTNHEILIRANPIRSNHLFSKVANELGIEQFIATSRIPTLRFSTMQSVNMHYPWIKIRNVYIRDYLATDGDIFKATSVRDIGPAVHFEDSVRSAKKILSLSDTKIILFPRTLEVGKISDSKVIEFADLNAWVDLVEAYTISY